MPVHQDHKIIGEPGVFDIRPPLNTSDVLRSLQHPVYLIKVDVTEQRRNHPALRNALSARRLQHHPEEPQHRVVAHPTRDLLEYHVMSHRIEGTYDTLPVISTSPRKSLSCALAIRSKADRLTFSVRCIGKVGYFSF